MKAQSILRHPALIGFVSISALFASCDKKKSSPNTPQGTDQPITLTCDYFKKNPNTVLTDNPNAPVDYIVTCVMDIDDDVTIEPGVTIAFKREAGFRIRKDGSLNAEGTSNNNITFTGKEKARGSWAGMYFSSSSSKNVISNTIIEYAGGKIGSADNAAIKLYSSSSGHARVTITNNTIRQNSNYGISLQTGSEEATISNNIFEKNEKPIRLKAEAVHLLNGNNTYIDNDLNKIHLHCYTSQFKESTTWQKASVPYLLYFTSGLTTGFSVNGHLTIEAGTIIEMSATSSIKVNDGASLKMIGKPDDYIIIRGEQVTAGYWGNISYHHTTNPNNILNYVKIQHAGNNPTSTKGAIYTWNKAMVTADHVEFKDILTCAFYSAPVLSGSSANPNLSTSNITYFNTGGEICGD